MKFAHLLGAVLWLTAASASAADLTIAGTGDGLEVLRALGAAYTADHPDTGVMAPPSIQSSGGIEAVRTGAAILGRVSRPLSLEQRSVGLVEVPAFRLPLVFIINPAANVIHLTSEQTIRIFSGEISNWQEVGGTNLRIKVIRRDESDSTLRVLRATLPGWRTLEMTDKSKLAVTTQEATDLVSELPGAISFAPYSRAVETNLVVPELDGLHMNDPEYPSKVTLSLVYHEHTVTNPALDFVRFLFTPKARALIRNLGGTPARPQGTS
jgi:phosphate transport system substrate-binding protein